jgi:uncharacterized OB-fold protein
MDTASYPLWSDAEPPALLASRDRVTKELVFPAVPADSPLTHRFDTVPLDGTGSLYSFTVMHPNPRSGLAPYALGFVDLPGPVRLFGRLLGEQRPAIGERYTARPDPDWGYVFAPLPA